MFRHPARFSESSLTGSQQRVVTRDSVDAFCVNTRVRPGTPPVFTSGFPFTKRFTTAANVIIQMVLYDLS